MVVVSVIVVPLVSTTQPEGSWIRLYPPDARLPLQSGPLAAVLPARIVVLLVAVAPARMTTPPPAVAPARMKIPPPGPAAVLPLTVLLVSVSGPESASMPPPPPPLVLLPLTVLLVSVSEPE